MQVLMITDHPAQLLKQFRQKNFSQGQQIDLYDPMKPDFYYVMQGQLVIKFKPSLSEDDESRPDVVIYMGQYIDPIKLMEYCIGQDIQEIDYQKLNTLLKSHIRKRSTQKQKNSEMDAQINELKKKIPKYQVVSITCQTRSCKLATLPHDQLMFFYNEPLLKKIELHALLASATPFMAAQSEKAKENFLRMYNIEVLNKGKVLALEGRLQERAYIVVKGNIAYYRRLYKLESTNNEARDKEQRGICHNQSLTRLSLDDEYVTDKMIQDNMPFSEKMKMLGQRLDVAPTGDFLCTEYVLGKFAEQMHLEDQEEDDVVLQESHMAKQECNYSLLVESDIAIVASVKKYDVVHKFPRDVKKDMVMRMFDWQKWFQRRTNEAGREHIKGYKEDKKKVGLQQQSQMNYPIANRNSIMNLVRKDMQKAENEVKYFGSKNFGFSQRRTDAMNPYWLRGWQDEEQRQQDLQVYNQKTKELRGYISQDDLLRLHKVQEFVYGCRDIEKLEKDIFDNKTPNREDLKGRTNKQIKSQMNYMKSYMKDVRAVKQQVVNNYNSEQIAQYEKTKESYIKTYYKNCSVDSKAQALPQINNSYLDSDTQMNDLYICSKVQRGQTPIQENYPFQLFPFFNYTQALKSLYPRIKLQRGFPQNGRPNCKEQVCL